MTRRDATNLAFSVVTFGYLAALAAAVVIRDYQRERARIAGVVAETRERLASVAPGLGERLRAQESAAVYDRAAWGDPSAAETATEGD